MTEAVSIFKILYAIADLKIFVFPDEAEEGADEREIWWAKMTEFVFSSTIVLLFAHKDRE